MSINYTKVNNGNDWDEQTPLSAPNMAHLENGTKAACDLLNQIDPDGDGKVASAENADNLGGNTPSYYAKASDLSNHTGNTSNPHNVTASQVGAKSTVAWVTGIITDEGTIPLPDGYTEEQCFWGAEPYSFYDPSSAMEFGGFYVEWPNGVNARFVKLYRQDGSSKVNDSNCKVRYWCVGIK